MPSMASLVGYHGVTHRQLDHWATKGYLPGGNPGSGYERYFSAEQATLARIMARLVEAGVKVDVAARMAPLLAKGKPVKHKSVIVALAADDEG